MVNSRSLLVTEACERPIKERMQAPFIPKVNGYFAEFPMLGYPDTPWLVLPAAPVIVLGTINQNRNRALFMEPGNQPV